MAVVTESREPANEVKFLIDSGCAGAIGDWARAHIGPDPFAQDPAGFYHTTSLYFDTEELDVLHRRGSYARSKYRVRRYGRAENLFLERKLKKSGVVTKKRSIIGLTELGRLSDADAQKGWNGYWFHRRILARQLRPICQISYLRLARVTHTEAGPLRLTMDQELRANRTEAMLFDHGTSTVPLSEKNPILELKFRNEMPALFHKLVKEFSLSPAPVSKYRLGVAALGISDQPIDESAECEPDEQPTATAI